MNSRMKHAMMLTVTLTITALMSGCFTRETTENISEDATLNPGALLNLTQQVGDVEITGRDVEAITLNATKRVEVWSPFALVDPEKYLDEIDVSFSSSANQADIETDIEPLAWFAGIFSTANLSVDYKITVPRELAINLECAVGDVSIEDISGELNLDLNVGDLVLADVNGQLEIQNDVGDVDIQHTAFFKESESISCDINIGDVSLGLPENSAFEITAATSIGDIKDNGFGLDVTEENITGAKLESTVGESGNPPGIDISVNTGNITLSALDAADEEFTDEELLDKLQGFWEGTGDARASAVRFDSLPEQVITGYAWDDDQTEWYVDTEGTFSFTAKAVGKMLVAVYAVYNPDTGAMDYCDDCTDTLDFSVTADGLEISGAEGVWFSNGVYE